MEWIDKNLIKNLCDGKLQLIFLNIITLLYCVITAKIGISHKELEDIRIREEIKSTTAVLNFQVIRYDISLNLLWVFEESVATFQENATKVSKVLVKSGRLPMILDKAVFDFKDLEHTHFAYDFYLTYRERR